MIDISNGTDIYINKGNSVTFTITMSGDDVPEAGTEILFVVRRKPKYMGSIIQKSLTPDGDTLTVEIDPADTEEIEPGNYFWNIIIMFDGGASPWTVSKDALNFIILPEIGREQE